ncbi:hypothetical protein [Mastigocladopsis repens]|uniref:hypothetical protein n=1 Tax=Mastigocladopsis repens TaxID=221287 RepID=UPI0002F8349C|nr:hypothetical protein [Mastigocladopsis repens]
MKRIKFATTQAKSLRVSPPERLRQRSRLRRETLLATSLRSAGLTTYVDFLK